MAEVTISSEQTSEEESKNKYFGIDKPKYSFNPAADRNVLHGYRSYSYVITLAALTRTQYNDPDFFKNNKPFDYVILKSSGKGAQSLSATSEYFDIDAQNAETGVTIAQGDAINDALEGFNSNGAGRFDFYIDNLEIDSNWNSLLGAQPCGVRFDVFEPFGINGFIEAVRVNALAAGFKNHVDAPYALRIEFIGYKDDDGLPLPTPIPASTRTMVVALTDVSLETSDKGTQYRVAGNVKAHMALGEDGKLATTVKMKGKTVAEVLDSLKDQLTEARKNDHGSEETKNYNEYKIKFEGDDAELVKKISEAKINEELRSNQIYVFPTPADKNPKSGIRVPNEPQSSAKYNPSEETITFSSSVSVLDVIGAVVRDSTYTADLLGTIEDAKKKNNGFIPWFRVTVDSEIKPGQNDKSGSLNYIFTYTVRPYMTHYSRLPGEGRGLFSGEDIKDQIRRSYDYIYTGKSVDILDFKLKFDYLFYQQRPYNLGNKDASGTAVAAGASETPELKSSETTQDGNSSQSTSKVLVNTSQSRTIPDGGQGKAGQASPYLKLAQLTQESLLDSVDLHNISLTIIGDPFYFATANMTNQRVEPDTSAKGMTMTGEADYLGGDVMIALNFRNPKDIGSNGIMDFGTDLLPFSGVYKVIDIINTFKEGRFEQRIGAVRYPGQIIDSSTAKSSAALISTPKEGEQKVKDTAPASVDRSGARASFAELLKLTNQGLPTIGLPGILSNFTNAVGGAIGGVGTSLQTTLQRVDASVADALAPVNGLLQQAQSVLNFAAQVGGIVAAGQALINGFDNPGGAPGLGQTTGGYNPYNAGIRVNLDGLVPGDSNQASIVSQSRIVSSFIQDPNNVRLLNQNYYNNVVSERVASSDANINNVGDKAVAITNSTDIDPKALAYKLGLDPKQLAGMSSSQQSNLLNKLLALANKIPENTDIAGLKALGISMKNIYAINMPNLPALQPLTLAPLANIPRFDLQKILASGGNVNNLPGALALPGMAAFLALMKKQKSVPNNGIVGGSGSLNVQSTLDKLETTQNMSINLQSNGNFSNAQLGLGSVESNLGTTVSTVQGYGGYYVISKTSYAQFGTQRNPSPIDKLMQTKV